MDVWMLLLGAALVALVFVDAASTTVSSTGTGGPVTGPFGQLLWRALRSLARGPRSRPLVDAGPLIVFAMLAVWLGGLWLGWTLVFAADPAAIVTDGTDDPVGFVARAYFAGFATYTLGVGDVVPGTGPWQLAAVAATISGFALLTMTVSYLIPVTQAVTARRAQAVALHGLGATAEQILRRSYDGDGFASLTPHLREAAARLAHTSQDYLAYPVLHYFHAPRRPTAFEPGVAALHEAVRALDRCLPADVPGPDLLTRRRCLAAIEELTEVVGAFTGSADHTPDPLEVERLRTEGLPLTATTAETDTTVTTRATLHAMVAARDWRGEVVEA